MLIGMPFIVFSGNESGLLIGQYSHHINKHLSIRLDNLGGFGGRAIRGIVGNAM